MKILATISILSILLANSCNAQSELDLTQVVFESQIRGGKKQVVINQDQIKFSYNQDEYTAELSKEKWNQLKDIIFKIDMDKYETYSTKNMDRARDAAWHSSISLTLSGDDYESQNFDNQNAPEQLGELMRFIVALEKKSNKLEKKLFQQ